MKVLAIDIGGSHVQIMATGYRKKRKAKSGPAMSAPDIYVPLHHQVIVWAMRDEPELAADLQNMPHFAWHGLNPAQSGTASTPGVKTSAGPDPAKAATAH